MAFYLEIKHPDFQTVKKILTLYNNALNLKLYSKRTYRARYLVIVKTYEAHKA